MHFCKWYTRLGGYVLDTVVVGFLSHTLQGTLAQATVVAQDQQPILVALTTFWFFHAD
jgi:hypothetical protein